MVFDTVGGDVQRRSFKVLKNGGILVSILEPFSSLMAAFRGVRARFIFVQPDAQQLQKACWIADGSGGSEGRPGSNT